MLLPAAPRSCWFFLPPPSPLQKKKSREGEAGNGRKTQMVAATSATVRVSLRFRLSSLGFKKAEEGRAAPGMVQKSSQGGCDHSHPLIQSCHSRSHPSSFSAFFFLSERRGKQATFQSDQEAGSSACFSAAFGKKI